MLTDNLTTGSKLSYSLQRGRGKEATPKVKSSQWSDTKFQNFNYCYFRYSFFSFTVKEYFKFITDPKLNRKRYSGSNHFKLLRSLVGRSKMENYLIQRLEVMLASNRAELKSSVLLSDSRRAGHPLSPPPRSQEGKTLCHHGSYRTQNATVSCGPSFRL